MELPSNSEHERPAVEKPSEKQPPVRKAAKKKPTCGEEPDNDDDKTYDETYDEHCEEDDAKLEVEQVFDLCHVLCLLVTCIRSNVGSFVLPF